MLLKAKWNQSICNEVAAQGHVNQRNGVQRQLKSFWFMSGYRLILDVRTFFVMGHATPGARTGLLWWSVRRPWLFCVNVSVFLRTTEFSASHTSQHVMKSSAGRRLRRALVAAHSLYPFTVFIGIRLLVTMNRAANLQAPIANFQVELSNGVRRFAHFARISLFRFTRSSHTFGIFPCYALLHDKLQLTEEWKSGSTEMPEPYFSIA